MSDQGEESGGQPPKDETQWEERKRLGVCVSCGVNPAAPGTSRCFGCSGLFRAYWRTRARKRRGPGGKVITCTVCGEPGHNRRGCLQLALAGEQKPLGAFVAQILTTLSGVESAGEDPVVLADIFERIGKVAVEATAALRSGQAPMANRFAIGGEEPRATCDTCDGTGVAESEEGPCALCGQEIRVTCPACRGERPAEEPAKGS